MPKRTLLLITESTLGRFDLSGGSSPKVTESWVRPSFASQSAGTLADAALRLGKSRKREVYVLTTRCWTGPVSVGPELVSGETGDDLKQIVALEGETYSGISAFESASSIVALPPDALGDHRFWLTQVPDEDVRSIDEALRQAGGKFAGIAHPSAPLLDSTLSPTGQWRSLQSWDETTLLLRGNGEAIADLSSLFSGMQSQRTVQEFETFFEGVDGEAPLQWVGPGDLPELLAETPVANGYQQIDTSAESGLRRWAAAWMRSQGKQSAGSPLVTIPKRPMSKEFAIAIASVLALLAIALCFAHNWQLNQQLAGRNDNIDQMTKQIDLLKAKEKKLEEAEKQKGDEISKSESKLAEARLAFAEVAEAKQTIEFGKRRWLSLVDSLSEVSDENGWIREIQSTDGTVAIRGLALTDSDVHRFAARLDAASVAKAWQILPATTKVDPDTKLIEFSIDLIAARYNN